MVRGIIEYNFEKKRGLCEIEDCDVAIVMSIRKNESDEKTVSYTVQNTIIGGAESAFDAVGVMGESILRIIDDIAGNSPAETYELLRVFLIEMDEAITKYLIKHGDEIKLSEDELIKLKNKLGGFGL